MTAKRALLALIVLMGVLYTSMCAVIQDYLLAAVALGLAAAWLILEINDKQTVPSLFFVTFTGFAVWGSLRALPIPVTLAGLSIDLAAWDLSRFCTRTANNLDQERNLEVAHLQKLAVTVGAGFGMALVPALIRLPIQLNFVIFGFVVLLAMVVLRKSVFSLRG